MSTGTLGALAGAGSVLVGAGHVGGLEAAGRGGGKVARMGRDHHALLGPQVEGLGRGEIDPRLRLVVARDLGSEDRIPGRSFARARSTISEMLPFETGAS